MKKGALVLSITTLLALALAGTAQAKLSVSMGYVHSHFHYWEHINPRDQETANMNGFKVVITNTAEDNAFQQLSFKYEESGQGRYDGFSIVQQKIPTIPYYYNPTLFYQYWQQHHSIPILYKTVTSYNTYKTSSSLSLYRLDYKQGIYFPISNKATIYSYLDLGYRYWRRQDNAGLDSKNFFIPKSVEYYRMGFAGLGAGLGYKLSNRVAVGVDAAYYIAPKWHSTNYMKSAHGRFDMGTATGYQVQVPISIDMTKDLYFNIGFYAQHWHFRQSNTNSQGWYEPSSETNEVGFVSGITYVF